MHEASIHKYRRRLRLLVLPLIVAVACGAFGQESRHDRIDDTSFVPLRFDGPGLSIHRAMSPALTNPGFGGSNFSIFLRQSLNQASPLSRDIFQSSNTLQSIWKDELARQNKYMTLRNILGAVEAGAVGYLAYQHLKRYGLK
jgi:hypothetical protein